MAICNGTIGEISVKNDNIEWTIMKIFSYKLEDVYYHSHDFDISGLKWYFRIYPCGDTVSDYGNCGGWISLYLLRRADSTNPPFAATYRFGVKKVDGIVEEIGSELNWIFRNDATGYGNPSFLLRSELLKRRSEIAPSDAMTLTCTLRLTESLNTSERLDILSQNLVDMFISKRGCDVTLKVKGETFSVHKAILSARSPVFATMFEVEMKEKTTGIADIVDCEPEAFKDFLMYLYSGRIENISSNVYELYRIADKYDIKELRSACIISMMDNLSVENVLDVAILGHRSNVKELQIKSQGFFEKNFQEIVSTVNWESLMENDWRLANELLKKMAPKIKL